MRLGDRAFIVTHQLYQIPQVRSVVVDTIMRDGSVIVVDGMEEWHFGANGLLLEGYTMQQAADDPAICCTRLVMHRPERLDRWEPAH